MKPNDKSKAKGVSTRELKRQLVAQAQQLQKDIAYQVEALKLPGATRGEIVDEAAELVEQSTSLALLEQLRGVLMQVEGALRRLEHGTYGICEECHKPISAERLKALPYASLCIQCQARHKP